MGFRLAHQGETMHLYALLFSPLHITYCGDRYTPARARSTYKWQMVLIYVFLYLILA